MFEDFFSQILGGTHQKVAGTHRRIAKIEGENGTGERIVLGGFITFAHQSVLNVLALFNLVKQRSQGLAHQKENHPIGSVENSLAVVFPALVLQDESIAIAFIDLEVST